MKFEIKILNPNNTSKNNLFQFFRIKNLEEFIKSRFKLLPKISFDSDFKNKNTIYLLFGFIDSTNYDNIKRAEQYIFYFSARFTATYTISDNFKFIGFCDNINYLSNFPMFYGRKQVSEKMENVTLGLTPLSRTDYYISTNSKNHQTKGTQEFVFDYLELYSLLLGGPENFLV